RRSERGTRRVGRSRRFVGVHASAALGPNSPPVLFEPGERAAGGRYAHLPEQAGEAIRRGLAALAHALGQVDLAALDLRVEQARGVVPGVALGEVELDQEVLP